MWQRGWILGCIIHCTLFPTSTWCFGPNRGFLSCTKKNRSCNISVTSRIEGWQTHMWHDMVELNLIINWNYRFLMSVELNSSMSVIPGGGWLLVIVLWAAQHGFKARPWSMFKEAAELLMYCASLTLLLYQSASCSSTDNLSIGWHGLSFIRGMQWQCWCWLASLPPNTNFLCVSYVPCGTDKTPNVKDLLSHLIDDWQVGKG